MFSARAPAYSGPGDKASAMAFVTGELKEWILSGKPARTRAMDAYKHAVKVATSDDERALALLEGASVASWFADQFLRAGTAAMPTLIREDAELNRGFVEALQGVVASHHVDARSALELCVGLPRVGATKDRCAAALSQLPVKEAPPPSPAPEGEAQAKSRPFVATTRPTPCTFAGSLAAQGLLYAAENGGTAIAALDGISAVEVTELSPPEAAGKRAKVRIEWPIQLTAWLGAEVAPLAVARRVDVVPEHVFVNPGHPVQGSEAAGGGLAVSADFRKEFTGIVPATLSTRLSCAELELARGYAWSRPPAGDWKALRSGAIPLHDAPNGVKIGVLTQKGTFAGDSQEGWVRARGNAPFAYDGWIRAADLGAEPGPTGIIAALVPRQTHTVTKPLPVHTTDAPGQAPFARLVPGAPIRLGKTKGDLVEVISQVAIGGAPKGNPKPVPGGQSLPAHVLPPWFASAADVASSTERVPTPATTK